jgi:hypothetical protein
MNRSLRWMMSVVALGVVPLALANVIGFREGYQVYTTTFDFESKTWQKHDRGLRTRYWHHGWPRAYLSRLGELPWRKTALRPGDARAKWMSYHDPLEPKPIEMAPPSSCWPFDGAQRVWRHLWLLHFCNVVVWAALLFGTGLAAARSRFVQTGRPQLALSTYLLCITSLAGYVGAYANRLVSGWEQGLLLPLLVSAFLGYASLLNLARKRDRSC